MRFRLDNRLAVCSLTSVHNNDMFIAFVPYNSRHYMFNHPPENGRHKILNCMVYKVFSIVAKCFFLTYNHPFVELDNYKKKFFKGK